MGKGNVKIGMAPVVPKHQLGSSAQDRVVKASPTAGDTGNREGQFRRLS